MVGAVVRDRRRVLGITQRELADLAGVSTRLVQELEAGKSTVRVDKLSAVATALGLTLVLVERAAS
jgi:y4mF family transcriptional regulator